MQLSHLTAISPIDGRYHSKTKKLSVFFSEYALINYRVLVEIEYLIALSKEKTTLLDSFNEDEISKLRSIYSSFSLEDAQRIKDIEATTNHDVKAVEYFLKGKVKSVNLNFNIEAIHFGLTSQDINNTAIPYSIKEADIFMVSEWESLKETLLNLASNWMEVAMLARTHGQPASPTSLGKELGVFVERIENQLKSLKAIPYAAKFGGATGNFNAHHIAFPNHDWIRFGNEFLNESLGLERMQWTTQIEHYDWLAARFDAYKRLNTIVIDLCRDIWSYISIDYFKQKTKVGEIGSSAMPHKVNPIDFENAEGNLGIANAIFEHLAAKLPISRLQRDLTDSTVLRNIGVPYAHMLIALQSIKKGLEKLILNKEKIDDDLDQNWAVVAEAIQTVLRVEKYPNPYEALKELTRGEAVTKEKIKHFINGLDVSETTKAKLLSISPHNYKGVFPPL
jgi:adenylosuccinate lyase